MRALLVYAQFPKTYWGIEYGLRIAGKRASLPPLGLVTLAALLPADWQLRLVDMNVEPLREADLAWADAVLVGGMHIQGDSMREVVRRAKALGKRTIVGGPGPSTAPEAFPEADVVFGGEAEGREQELVALIEGDAKGVATSAGAQALVRLDKSRRPDVKISPVPRYDLLRLDAYTSMSVQQSRGCPFTCEFCDIIEIFGRLPRMKTPPQVLRELDTLYALGWRGSVFIVDDNFIGNVREIRKLLPELQRWQDQRAQPFEFYTEASVNLAKEAGLPEAMVAAGFSSVFLGIETPSSDSLKAAKKLQNLKLDLGEAIDRLTRVGLEVMGGFIVGFDTDDAGAFEIQREFLARAPIPLAMIGMLTALPGTALWRRLQAEGRLRSHGIGDAFGRPNFVTAMDEEVLLSGYASLMRELYSIDGYLARCLAHLERAPARSRSPRLRAGWQRILLRSLWHLGVKSPRRRILWTLLAKVVQRSPGHVAWAFEKAIQGEHFLRYTEQDVLPMVARALAELRAERSSEPVAVKPPPRVRLRVAQPAT
ncbi:MAG: B12-binding domain-containing radical SAM protein [Nannocystaceae bacterium]